MNRWSLCTLLLIGKTLKSTWTMSVQPWARGAARRAASSQSIRAPACDPHIRKIHLKVVSSPSSSNLGWKTFSKRIPSVKAVSLRRHMRTSRHHLCKQLIMTLLAVDPAECLITTAALLGLHFLWLFALQPPLKTLSLELLVLCFCFLFCFFPSFLHEHIVIIFSWSSQTPVSTMSFKVTSNISFVRSSLSW